VSGGIPGQGTRPPRPGSDVLSGRQIAFIAEYMRQPTTTISLRESHTQLD
jgi:hypothetical protein